MKSGRERATPASGPIALLALGAVLSLAGCAASADKAAGQGPGGPAPSEARVGSGGRVQPEFPPGKFTVQLGAYQSEEGAAGVAALSRSRFTKEVYTVFNSVDGLYKVMLGVFDSKDAARNFRDTIVRQYPDDYRDAWVAELSR